MNKKRGDQTQFSPERRTLDKGKGNGFAIVPYLIVAILLFAICYHIDKWFVF